MKSYALVVLATAAAAVAALSGKATTTVCQSPCSPYPPAFLCRLRVGKKTTTPSIPYLRRGGEGKARKTKKEKGRLLANLCTYLIKRYYDGQEGACGCGTSAGAFGWQTGIASGVYTAAGSQALFDAANSASSWCGAGCGTCYQLTSTGAAPCAACGTGGVSGQSITVMVTNLCPYNGNAQWCPQVG